MRSVATEDIDVTALLVTVNSAADRIALHAVRRSLLEAQADRLDVPRHIVEIPSPCSNEIYEVEMATAMDVALADGIKHVVFGDLFLADVRAYREERLDGTGISPSLPVMGSPDRPRRARDARLGREGAFPLRRSRSLGPILRWAAL
jgi:diphthamide synthase (EF-2-diphthine--ammonia ligase)